MSTMHSPTEENLEQLPKLYGLLMAHGFLITIDRWQSFCDLLISLKTEGQFPANFDEMGRLACPLFASNRDEQDKFWRVFALWQVSLRNEKLAEEISARKVTATPQKDDKEQETRQTPTKPWALWLIIALIFAAAIAGLAWNFTPTEVERPKPIVEDTTDNNGPTDTTPIALNDTQLTPVPPRQPAEPITFDVDTSEYINYLYLFGALPALLLALWFWYQRLRHRMVLRLKSGKEHDPLETLFLPGEVSQVFHLENGLQSASSLRRAGYYQTTKLDAKRTINATIGNAGLFVPVLKARPLKPEYLVLIDNRHRLDHTTQFFIAFITQLAQERQLQVHLYEYRKDPRVCFSLDTAKGRRPIKLSNLSQQYPNARLIVTGHADGLFDDLSGDILPWTDLFNYWQTRIWLSPRPQPWTRRENQLIKSGFAVAPLTGQGIQDTISWIDNPNKLASRLSKETWDRFPSFLLLDESQWLADHPPKSYDFVHFRQELFDYLGPRGLELLIGCAIYPHLHADLTFALEQRLFPYDTLDRKERRLLKLSRLPWFKLERIPRYIRKDLIDSKSRESLEKFAEIYRDIFQEISNTASGQVTYPLSIAGVAKPQDLVDNADIPDPEEDDIEEESEEQTAAKNKKRQKESANRRFMRYLRDRVRFAQPGSAFGDRIFSQVILGRRASLLDFIVPDTLAKWLPLPQSRFWPAASVATALFLGLATAEYSWQTWMKPLAQTKAEERVFANNRQFNIQITATQEALQLGRALATALELRGYSVLLTRLPQTTAEREVNTNALLPSTSKIYFTNNSDIAPVIHDIRSRLNYLSYGIDAVFLNPPTSVEINDVNAIQIRLTGNLMAGGIFTDRFTNEFSESEWQVALEELRAQPTIPDNIEVENKPINSTPEGTEFNDTLQDGSAGPTMVVIPAGRFLMGSPEDVPEGLSDEGPQRQVTITSFAMGKYEVTFDEYDAFARATGRELPGDRDWGRGQRPAIYVSWHDAQAYVSWLSAQTGQRYRLPYESEWEYAARAGTTTPFSTGECISGEQANFASTYAYQDCPVTEDYADQTVNVGSYAGNAFGLHDMHGNVYEWVEDCWHRSYDNAPVDSAPWLEEDGGDCDYRVLRGGSWLHFPRFLRSAYRNRFNPVETFNIVGFRIARDI